MSRRGTLRRLRWSARAVAQLVLGLLPWVPTRGPTRAAQVTPSWLNGTLAARVDGAEACSVRVLGGTSGTTDRRRLAIEWNEPGRTAGLPAAVFVKSTPLTAKNRTMVASLDMAVNEVRFYRQVRDEVGDIAPHAWFTHSGWGARHLLVLDDLSALGCRTYVIADAADIAHAEAVIDILARLHAVYWESPRFDGELAWVRRWSERPGYVVLKTFYRTGRRKALTMPGWDFDTPAVRALVNELTRFDTVIWRRIEELPSTLLHGDPHLGNTYSLPDGTAGLLDWQVVWRGPGLRDASYFILSALEPEQRRLHERALLTRYIDGLRERGITNLPTDDEAYQLYLMFVIEAFDAAALTVAWPGLCGVAGVAACVRRIHAAVEELDLTAALHRLVADVRS